MVKSVLSTSRKGLHDWLIQRLTAIIMTVYVFGLMGYLFMQDSVNYIAWHYLFSHTWMKVATLLVIVSILFHAWVGIWTVLTDYVKPFVLRFILYVLVLITLAACFFWALLILWSV